MNSSNQPRKSLVREEENTPSIPQPLVMVPAKDIEDKDINPKTRKGLFYCVSETLICLYKGSILRFMNIPISAIITNVSIVNFGEKWKTLIRKCSEKLQMTKLHLRNTILLSKMTSMRREKKILRKMD